MLEDSDTELQPAAESEGMPRLGSGRPSDQAASRQLPPGAKEQNSEAAEEAAGVKKEMDLLAAKKRELLARVEELRGASSGAVIAGIDWQLGNLLGQLNRQHNANHAAKRQTDGAETQPEEPTTARQALETLSPKI